MGVKGEGVTVGVRGWEVMGISPIDRVHGQIALTLCFKGTEKGRKKDLSQVPSFCRAA